MFTIIKWLVIIFGLLVVINIISPSLTDSILSKVSDEAGVNVKGLKSPIDSSTEAVKAKTIEAVQNIKTNVEK